MTSNLSITLFHDEGNDFRDTKLTVESDGGLKIYTHDIGPRIKQVLDHDDYEFSVRIPPSSVAMLAFTLLREKYAGRSRAVDELHTYCKQHQIESEWESWP